MLKALKTLILTSKIYGSLLCIHCPLQRFQRPLFWGAKIYESSFYIRWHLVIYISHDPNALFGVWTPTMFWKHLVYKQQWRQKKNGLLLFQIRFWFSLFFFLWCVATIEARFHKKNSSDCRNWISLLFSNYCKFC
jgi:hypothetical protein